MTKFNIQDAKTHFSKLIERVLNGEEVVIAKAGIPVERILPFVAEDISPRVPGIDKGKVIIMRDFDAPLPEFDPWWKPSGSWENA
jgi:prevent-host-death family protein